MRRLLIAFLIMVLCMLSVIWLGVNSLEQWALKSIEVPAETHIELRPRLTLDQLSQQLEEKKVVQSARLFQVWMRLVNGYGQFQAGTYLFVGPVSPVMIREKMTRGEIFVPNVLQVIIPEGFTLRMLNERLATKGIAQLKELNSLVRDAKFLKELGVESKSLEGYTAPATYNFTKLPTAREFYAIVVKKFFDRLPPTYVQDAKKMGLTLNQAVTFASLIEMETMLESEKPMISEVIWNRLKKGDALGIDAALIYGIPNYQGDITWAHLKDTKNPYNTRIHRGLPPTAIGAVTRSSLEAVLNPTNLGYYYYMLDADDRTKHVFTKTARDHNVQVQRFLRAQKSQSLSAPQATGNRSD